MGLRIRTNVANLNAQRRLGQTSEALAGNMEKMSSGLRINKSADDAAGLAISETLTGKIRSLDQAKRNANDGISMIQVAEGGMSEVSNILVRMRELATQSASDTIGNTERSYSNKEYNEMVKEIDRISATTEYNGTKVLGGADANGGKANFTLHVGSGDGHIENTDTIELNIDKLKMNAGEVLGLETGSMIGPEEAGGDFDRQQAADKLGIIDKAIETIAGSRAELGAKQSRLNSTINNLGVAVENASTTRSRIRDVDFAAVTAEYAQNRILAQAGTSVLAQSSQAPELALKLL
ncbi:MAG: flagellin FliC [Chitinophagaceae bacterium]|nr:flagellin FliC [Oligoflexus sp.]